MVSGLDLLIVGAGPAGCVIAEQAARHRGWKSLIIEKRDHIAGNCYDEYRDGILIHRYGPHYFRTNSKQLLEYLSRFTSWIPGNYIVKSKARGRLYPFPINLNTLRSFFEKDLTAESARSLLDQLRDHTIVSPKNAEEFVLSRIGRQLYEAFYLGYTLKQWDRHPADLAPSVCGRIPIRLDEDDRYVNHTFQVMPRDGFTQMFRNMISRPEISVLLNADFHAIRNEIRPRIATVYCGPLDAYFDYRFGRLPWRSLHFEFKTFEKEYVQPCVQINYPDAFDYTRTVEVKHVTGQRCAETVVSYEYPRAEGDPYYPVPDAASQQLCQRYLALAENERRKRRVYFVGRLARYTYINSDEAIEMALKTFAEIDHDFESCATAAVGA
jgi:UDP-galactopyranose mutase